MRAMRSSTRDMENCLRCKEKFAVKSMPLNNKSSPSLS